MKVMRTFLPAAVTAAVMVPATALAQTPTPAPTPAPTSATTPTQTGPTDPAQSTAAPTQPPTTQQPATPAPGPTILQRFAGSTFASTVRVNSNFFYSVPSTPNESVITSFNLAPRFAINRYIQLRASVTLNVELTDTPYTSTVTKREPRFLDPILSVFFRGIPQFGGIAMNPFISLGFPVSPESRANTLILNSTVGVQFFRGFEHVLGGDLSIIARASYNHPFFQYNTSGVRGTFQYPRSQGAGLEVTSALNNQLSGGYNAQHSLGWAVILVQEWGRFQPGLFFSMTHDFSSAPTDVIVGEQTSTNYSQSTFFAAWIDVAWNPWLTTELGYQMFRPSILDRNSTIGNPIWSPDQRMDLYVQAIFNLDKLYQAISGEGRGAGGIIRAQRNPARTYGFF